jgi:hypothetical protein
MSSFYYKTLLESGSVVSAHVLSARQGQPERLLLNRQTALSTFLSSSDGLVPEQTFCSPDSILSCVPVSKSCFLLITRTGVCLLAHLGPEGLVVDAERYLPPTPGCSNLISTDGCVSSNVYRDLLAVHFHMGVLQFIKAVPLHGGLNIISVQGTHALLSVNLPGEPLGIHSS